MAANPSHGPGPAPRPGLKRSLSVWQAVGLSLALMAPSMAANINPQGAIGAGRAGPRAVLIAAGGGAVVGETVARGGPDAPRPGCLGALRGRGPGPPGRG